MRYAILFLALINPSLALAEGGPWSAPQWAVSTSETHGPFTHATTLYVSSSGGHDVVEAVCSITDRRAPKDAVIIKAKGRAQMAQGLWCGGAGKLGTWCVDLVEGATMEWYDKTICAGGPASFSTGD